MGYEGFAAKLAEVLDEPAYLSEDIALPEAIDRMIKKDPEHSNFYVFDRGLSSLRAYDSMTEQHARFVTASRPTAVWRRCACWKSRRPTSALRKSWCWMRTRSYTCVKGGSRKFGTEEYRVITYHFKEPRDTTRPQNKGKAKRVENRICFITNDMELPVKEVAEIYRRRWDIEVFFRFLKQELSFSHFLSVNENGLQVILYMTLITTMLVMIYKRENKLGYSILSSLSIWKWKTMRWDLPRRWLPEIAGHRTEAKKGNTSVWKQMA